MQINQKKKERLNKFLNIRKNNLIKQRVISIYEESADQSLERKQDKNVQLSPVVKAKPKIEYPE